MKPIPNLTESFKWNTKEKPARFFFFAEKE